MKSKRITTKLVTAAIIAAITVVPVLGQASIVNAAPNNQSFQNSDTTLIAQVDDPAPDPGDPDPDPPDDGDGPLVPEETCETSFAGLGWILCQITRSIYAFFDYLVQNILAEKLLQIDLIDDEPALELVWGSFKNIANMIFIIMFLIIIYSEASGRFGALETYSFQRILPRLAFSVIGIQLSYGIVAYLIALFNDFGAGAMQIVLAPLDGFSQFELAGVFSNLTEGDTWFGLAINAGGNFVDNLAGVMITAGLGLAGIILMPTMLFYGMLGLLLLFLVLMARKIFVIVLVIMAPLAFASFVLPGTERFFKQWWDWLIRLLFMYPLIMIFIGAGQLLGRLAIAGEDTTFIDSVIGFTATFLPLFLVPITFRLAGSLVTGITGTLRNMNEKAKGRPEDPRSIRSTLRSQRGRTWNRMMSGAQPGVPEVARRQIKRLPFVDSRAALITEMAEGEQWAKGMQTTGSDELLRLIAVTGGGRWRGQEITLGDGTTSYTGWAKLGKQLYRDEQTGRLVLNNGMAQTIDKDGVVSLAGAGDFYSREEVAEARSMKMSRGRLVAAGIYTTSKAPDEYSQAQVMHGLRSSRWTGDELKDYVNGYWALNKRDKLHLKFLDYDYMKAKPGRTQDHAIREGEFMDTKAGSLKKSFKKMAEYFDEEVRGYDAAYLQGAVWRHAQKGVMEWRTNEMPDRMRKHVRGMYDKAATNIRDPRRAQVPEYNDDGDMIGYSQATPEAIREMRKFAQIIESPDYRDLLNNGRT